MKKTVYLCAAALMAAVVSCGGGQGNQSQTQNQEPKQEEPQVQKQSKPFPWDYPEDVKAPGLESGCHALVPSILYVTAEDPANEMYYFGEVVIKKVGEKSSTFAGQGLLDVEMPNSLIIPLAKNQTAKKGDVLLTWWQTGSGSQRAIVTDDSDPARPKVAYLDLVWDENNSYSSAQKNMDQQLEPGSFTVLKSKEWMPGQNIVYNIEGNDEIFELISFTDNKALGYRYDGKLYVLDRSKCTIVPTDQQFKVGDKVKAVSFGYLSEVKITKVEANIGRIWYADVLNDINRSILEVIK